MSRIDRRPNGRFYDVYGRDITETLTREFRQREGRIRGGSSKSAAKVAAAKRNGARSRGRPRKQTP
jgi:hypothetical protein